MEALKAFDRALFGGSPGRGPGAYADSSPITYVDAVRAPVLVLAGENDPRCPIRQIENYLARLTARGAPHRVYRYDAGHGSMVDDERVRQMRVELDFAAEHLGVVTVPSPPTTALLMAIDGNSLLHRAHHAHEHSGQRDLPVGPPGGCAAWSPAIGGAAARLGPDAVVVGFDCAGALVRRDEYPEYKAGPRTRSRPTSSTSSPAPWTCCARAVSPWCSTRGGRRTTSCASAAALARRRGWRCTVVTSDRDSFALIDETTSVLRIIAGGVDASPLLTPARLPLVCGVAAGQYRDYAAVRGDVSDNLPGAAGIGAQDRGQAAGGVRGRGRRLRAPWTAAASRRSSTRSAGRLPAAGRAAARANVARNLRLMAMRRTCHCRPEAMAGADGPGAPAGRPARAGHPARAVAVGADRQPAAR